MRLKQEDKIDIIVMAAIKELIKDDNIFIDFVQILSDVNLYSHILAVAKFSVALAIEYDFNKKDLINIAKGGLLHDTGKLFIDRNILYKPGRFTDAEYELVKQHPKLGYEHIKDKTDNKFILGAIKQHHERIDSKGYPDGIEEKELYIQIITVSDIFSALTEARVYKKAMYASKAFEILEGDSGVNQDIVQVLKGVVFDEYEIYFRAKKLAKYYRQYFKEKHDYSFDFEED